eukprot:155710-Pelagomonas_calceolata.AAC.2
MSRCLLACMNTHASMCFVQRHNRTSCAFVQRHNRTSCALYRGTTARMHNHPSFHVLCTEAQPHLTDGGWDGDDAHGAQLAHDRHLLPTDMPYR